MERIPWIPEAKKVSSSIVNWKPRVGMEFDNIDAAWHFWTEYGRKVGFGVRKQYTNKRKEDGTVSSCRFVCCREGHRKDDKRNVLVTKHRAETRTECKARIGLLLGKNGKFVIHEFVEDHNHSLQLPEHCKITDDQAENPEAQSQTISQEKDRKIQELTKELQHQNQLCQLYRQLLLSLLQNVEEQTEVLTGKLELVVSKVKQLESEVQKPLDTQ